MNVLVTNGYIQPEPLDGFIPHRCHEHRRKAGMKASIAASSGERADPVRRTVEQAADAGVWVEVAYLVIPGENDADEHIDS